MTTYTKLAADGTDLPPDATGHQAVRIAHPMLAAPLIVTAYHAPKEMTQKQAEKWAALLDIYDWSWRLMSIEEAFWVPDRSKFPATPKLYFPDIEEYEWMRTSTVDAEDPSGYAWIVYLRYGYVNRYVQAFHGHVRAVRAGQN